MTEEIRFKEQFYIGKRKVTYFQFMREVYKRYGEKWQM